MANESLKKTVGFATLISLFCAILVSSAVIILRKMEAKNRQQEKMIQILRAGSIDISSADIDALFQNLVTPMMIELSSGKKVTSGNNQVLPELHEFNVKKLSQDSRFNQTVPRDQDLAGLKRIPKYMVIYKVKGAGSKSSIILPIHGKGLWSTMYGYLALLATDIRTVTGITFYQHGETPGLGGEIDNRQWQQSWQGKLALNSQGKVILQVKKGRAASESQSEIDGLSGATITSRGVGDMIKFWLGNNEWLTGYGPFLKKIMEKQTNG